MKKWIWISVAVLCVVCLLTVFHYNRPALDIPEGFPQLSLWKQQQIEKAWYHANGYALYDWFAESRRWGTRYYGSYDGYDILFVCGGEAAAVVTVREIGGRKFSFGSAFTIYAYKDGIFTDLKQAYKDGLISAEAISSMADIHENYEEFVLSAAR